MYNEEEQIQNLKATATNLQKIAVEIYKFRNQLIEKEKMNAKEALQKAFQHIINPNTEFVFTGKITDLSYFQNTNLMPFQFIENIPDERVKEAVKAEFNYAAKNGYIIIEPNSRMITITEKGKKYIDKPEFKKEAVKQTAEVLKEYDLCVPLTGTERDLGVFAHTPEINLNEIINNASAPEQGVKVFENFNKMKNNGLIEISNNIAKITEKGSKTLGSFSNIIAKKSVASLGAVGAVIIVVQKAVNIINNVNDKKQTL